MTRAHLQRRRGQDGDSAQYQPRRGLQRIRRPMIWLILILLILFVGPALVSLTGERAGLASLGLAINLPGMGRIGRARRP